MIHYQRSGIPRGEFHPVRPRLANSTVKSGDCWLFQRGMRKSGHAKIGYKGGYEFVHRISWMEFRGPIPEGKCVLHNCIGHPNCWNPDHLYIGTKLENARDRDVQGRAASHKGESNGRSKLSEQSVLDIRNLSTRSNTMELATRYGVSASTIRWIRDGRSWKHVAA